jgi:protein-S-isoprenylcysteine O-methyltransferase Ste14
MRLSMSWPSVHPSGSGKETQMGTLLGVTLTAQVVLFVFAGISLVSPDHRVWPPPSRHSWQFHATWFLSWVSLSGVFLLAIFSESSLQLPIGLRLAVGVPLFGVGASTIAWSFRELSVETTLGVQGNLVRSGPYGWSRNPQYLGACFYLASLVVLSGSYRTAIGGLAVGLWFLATPFVEEPWLAERYGAEYEAYCKAVPRFFSFRRLRGAS